MLKDITECMEMAGLGLLLLDLTILGRVCYVGGKGILSSIGCNYNEKTQPLVALKPGISVQVEE